MESKVLMSCLDCCRIFHINVQVWIYAAKFITAAENKYKSLCLDGRNVCLDSFISHHHLKLFPPPTFLCITIKVLIYDEFAHIFRFLFNGGGIHTCAWEKDEMSVPSWYLESVALSKREGKQNHSVLAWQFWLPKAILEWHSLICGIRINLQWNTVAAI